MAAITILTPDFRATPGYAKLETVSITNQAAASTTVRKCLAVPAWADYATFAVDVTAISGTMPSFDFNLEHINIADTFPPDDADVTGLRDGFNYTAKTAASSSVIYVGPGVTEELTGSATADDSYALAVPLPPWIAYTYTTVGNGVDPEDYTATISVYFRR